MSRKRRALAGLDRLTHAGLGGLWREVMNLPLFLSGPVAKLATILHIPPLLVWAMLASLIGSAVLAVSWILTALLLAITRSSEASADLKSHPVSSGALDDDGPSDTGSDSDAGGDDNAAGPLAFKGAGVVAGSGTELHPPAAAGAMPAPADVPSGDQAPPQNSAVAVRPRPKLSAHHRGPPPVPYMDERQAAEVRRHVSYFTSVIPTSPFEAARVCNEMCALRLDPRAYASLLTGGTSTSTGTAAAAVTRTGRKSGGGSGADREDDDGFAGLGRLVLSSHMARYVYGLYETAATGARAGRGEAGESGAGDHEAGTGSPDDPTALQPPRPSAAAVLSASCSYMRSEVLTALARRLRLELIAQLTPPAQAQTQGVAQHKQLARVAAAVGNGKGWLGGGGLKARQMAAAAAAAAPSSSPPPAVLLLRLVWAVQVADPARCWLVACVLAGLARELQLVPEP